MFLITSV